MQIRELADELPRSCIVKTKIDLAPNLVARALDALEQHFDTARADRLDGLRLDWPDHWLLVRASNTKPIVRAVAEAHRVGGRHGGVLGDPDEGLLEPGIEWVHRVSLTGSGLASASRAGGLKDGMPVIASPRIRAWMSWVPS